MAVRRRSSGYQADFTHEGKRYREQFPTENQAIAWEYEAKAALTLGKPIPRPGTGKARGGLDLSTLGALYDHVERTHWRPMISARILTGNAWRCVEYFGTNRAVSSIGTPDLAELAAHFRDTGNSQSTINRKLATMSVMLRAAEEAGVINKVPRIPLGKEGGGRVRFLSEDEEALALQTWYLWGDTFMYDFEVFLLDTGARWQSEAYKLEWDHISSGFNTVHFPVTKNGRARDVALTKRAREALLRRRREASPEAKGPFTALKKEGIRSRFNRLHGHLGWEDVVVHTRRHTAASRLVQRGVDLLRVQKWMGHMSYATTLKYAHLAPDSLDDLASVLERHTKGQGRVLGVIRGGIED